MAGQNPPSGTVPEGTVDRILEALSRAWNVYLDDAKKRKLAELEDPHTLIAFGFLIAIWAGFQFTVLGPLADYALAAYGTYQLVGTLGALVDAGREAAAAATNDAMNIAAQHMAAALTDAAVDLIALILGAAVFKTLKYAVRGIRTTFSGKGISRVAEPIAETSGPKTEPTRVESEPGKAKPRAGEGSEASRPDAAGRRPVLDTVVGAGAGVGLEHGSVNLGKKGRELADTLNWLLPVVGGVALVAGIAGLAWGSKS